jgi:hypothetical protein
MTLHLGPYSRKPDDDALQAFVASIDGARERWTYVHDRAETTGTDPIIAPATRVMNAGYVPSSVALRLRAMTRKGGFAGADAWLTEHGGRGMVVGPFQAWNAGWVYFASVRSHPHVLKVGFSRRPLERIEDVARKIGTDLRCDVFRAGTHVDERWWHSSWRRYRIAGEWFFNPKSADRSLPAFLQPAAQAA